jgi:hypothetical protein
MEKHAGIFKEQSVVERRVQLNAADKIIWGGH